MSIQTSRLYHSGIPTFMRSEYITDLSKLQRGTVAVAGVPFDYTSGSRAGARYGPRSIRQSSLYIDYFLGSSKDQSYVDLGTGEVVEISSELNIKDLGDIDCFPQDLDATMAAISAFIKEICLREAFPVILGGDHFVTIPAFKGFVDGNGIKNKNSKIGYIHLDAHLDIFDNNPSWGRYYHGSTVRRILDSGLIDTRDVLLIGMHGLAGIESWEYISASGAKLITLAELRRDSIESAVGKSIRDLSERTDSVYLSVDIDSVAGAFAPGTGGITLDGLTPGELFKILELLAGYNIGGIDIVEVAPQYDPSERTQRIAAEALFTFLLKKGLIVR